MSRQVVVGKRNNGDLGIFVAPPGVDAFFATDQQLTLSITSKIAQLLMLGFVNGSGYVPLGFGASPYILLTGQPNMTGVPGYGSLNGPTRPSPIGIYGTTPNGSFADIVAGGAGMNVGSPVKCSYAVFNVPI
jgi:hypothetical protein